ncbi:MAG: Bug family tripartite tricarboxylate transporter substrate binding protein [Rhizobacter sp.]
MSLRNTFACGVAALAVLTGAPAVAEDYPAKPLEMVVMFPPGSSADVVARLVADGMSRSLGQQVLVMNRPGGGGAIGYRYVQAAKPDGYTLVFNSNSVSTVYYSGLTQFDYKAFDPVARTTVENPVIAVRADAPWKNLKDLMAAAKAKPGDIKMGNSGLGSHTHFTAVAFFGSQHAEVLHVPFGAAQVLTSLLGGNIDALVQLPGSLTPMVKSGKVRILGTLAAARDPAFPDVPTAMEQGFNYHAELWRGIAVPKGTPPQIINKLAAGIKAAVTSPEFKAQGGRVGFVPAFQGPKEFGQTIATEDALIGTLMAQTGLKPQ